MGVPSLYTSSLQSGAFCSYVGAKPRHCSKPSTCKRCERDKEGRFRLGASQLSGRWDFAFQTVSGAEIVLEIKVDLLPFFANSKDPELISQIRALVPWTEEDVEDDFGSEDDLGVDEDSGAEDEDEEDDDAADSGHDFVHSTDGQEEEAEMENRE